MSGTYDIAKIKKNLERQKALYENNTNIQAQIEDVMKDIAKTTPKIKINDASGKIVETNDYDPVRHVTDKLAIAQKN